MSDSTYEDHLKAFADTHLKDGQGKGLWQPFQPSKGFALGDRWTFILPKHPNLPKDHSKANEMVQVTGIIKAVNYRERDELTNFSFSVESIKLKSPDLEYIRTFNSQCLKDSGLIVSSNTLASQETKAHRQIWGNEGFRISRVAQTVLNRHENMMTPSKATASPSQKTIKEPGFAF